MTPEQLDLIPTEALTRKSRNVGRALIDWLAESGWTMTLLELETERKRRGIR